MTTKYQPLQRMLTIDPFRHGFGWAILEGDDLLIDWGVCQVRAKKAERVINRIAAIIHRYAPHVVIVEDTRHRLCRRGQRARVLIDQILDLAREAGIKIDRVSSRAIRRHYAKSDAANKDDIARQIADQFPELERILPPRRKFYMREDERMTVFDALAMAVTGFARNRARRPLAANRGKPVK